MAIRKIYEENSVTGFQGNPLNQDNFNSIVSTLLLMDFSSPNLLLSTVDFANGVKITPTYDATGNMNTLTIETSYLTQNTPLTRYTQDGLGFKNNDIYKIDTSTGSILDSYGVQFSSDMYILNSDGTVQFREQLSDNYIMMNNVKVISKIKFSFTRGSKNQITGWSTSQV